MNKNEVKDILLSLHMVVEDLVEAKYQTKMSEFRQANAHAKFDGHLREIERVLLAAAPTAKGE